jgi:hypothetical protein
MPRNNAAQAVAHVHPLLPSIQVRILFRVHSKFGGYATKAIEIEKTIGTDRSIPQPAIERAVLRVGMPCIALFPSEVHRRRPFSSI